MRLCILGATRGNARKLGCPSSASRSYIDSQRLLELPALMKDGEEIYVELLPSATGWASGKHYVMAVVRGITERKRVEEEAERRKRGCLGCGW